MKYCPKCKSMMMPKKVDGKTVLVCVNDKCGYTEGVEKVTTIKMKTEEKEIVIVDSEKEAAAMPTTTVECPKCGNNTAYWRLEQTRAADEPTTRIYTCTKCKHVWREY